MNVASVMIPPETAREKLKAVRTVLHRKAESEFEALERAYSAALEGSPILDLEASFEIAGFFPDGFPRLAVARADRKRVEVGTRWGRGRPLVFTTALRWTAHPGSLRVSVRCPNSPEQRTGGTTLVPMIPPEVRENHPASRDKDRLILWEVEEWEPTPDRDPMLLEHLAGNLYIVLAHWDLTELERLVMRGR